MSAASPSRLPYVVAASIDGNVRRTGNGLVRTCYARKSEAAG